MDFDDSQPLPSLIIPKVEERFEFDEDVEKKYEIPKRGRTRSLTKKASDKSDIKAKLERSRQSARECRARKKLRYQYLEEIISETEKSIYSLRKELEMLKFWAKEMEEGRCKEQIIQYRNAMEHTKINQHFKLEEAQEILLQQQRDKMQLLLLQQQQQQQNLSPSSSYGASANFGSGFLSPVGTPIQTTLSVSPSGGHLTNFMSMSLSPLHSKSLSPT